MSSKRGELYTTIKPKLRSFDLFIFKGTDLVSSTIRLLQRHGNKVPSQGAFSHVGLCLKYDMLKYIYPDDTRINKDCIYVWESSISGELGNKVYNIDGKTFLGVQLRNFDELVNAYDDSEKSAIAVGTLIDNPIDKAKSEQEIGEKFRDIYRKYDGRFYDANFCSLFSTIFPCIRPCRVPSEFIMNSQNWMFCSELVASVYKDLGVYPDFVDPKTVTPLDICYPETDIDKDRMKKIIGRITYITTPKHFRENISNFEYKVNGHEIIINEVTRFKKRLSKRIDKLIEDQFKEVLQTNTSSTSQSNTSNHVSNISTSNEIINKNVNTEPTIEKPTIIHEIKEKDNMIEMPNIGTIKTNPLMLNNIEVIDFKNADIVINENFNNSYKLL